MNRPIVALPQQPPPNPQQAWAPPAGPAASGVSAAPTGPTAPAASGTPTASGAGQAGAAAVPTPIAAPIAAPVGVPVPTPIAAPVAVPFAPPGPAPIAPVAAPAPGFAPQAVAQPVATTTAPQPEPAKPRTGGVRIGLAQILCWQLALVAVAVAARSSLGVLLGTSAAALALIALTAVPVRGAWPHQWAAIAVRYLLRRRQVELPELPELSGTAAPALLEPWLGKSRFDTAVVRDRPLALISNQAAMSALLRLDPAGSGIGVTLTSLLDPGAGLLDALDEQPVDVEIQLVIHAGLRRDRAPRGWVAVSARRTPDLSTDAGLSMPVKNATRRVLRHLERTGAATTQLDDREAATTLVSLAHANAGRGLVRERWTTWSAGPVSQACLRLTGFARLPLETASALVDALTGTAVNASVTVSVSARVAARTTARPEAERLDPVIRVAAASTGALDVATSVLGRLARAYGVQPERLDGRHGPGTATSLPIARTLV